MDLAYDLQNIASSFGDFDVDRGVTIAQTLGIGIQPLLQPAYPELSDITNENGIKNLTI